jgi:broad specificity polyphosphatase/5'/3'-nucleotidase SurE
MLQIKSELQALKDKLRVNTDGYSYNWIEDQGVAWKNDVQGQFQYLESKLISITEKLGKAGIDINYWEN